MEEAAVTAAWSIPYWVVAIMVGGFISGLGVLWREMHVRETRHCEERDTWIEYQKQMTQSIIDLQVRTITALDQNTEALRAMKEALAVDERFDELQRAVTEIKGSTGDVKRQG